MRALAWFSERRTFGKQSYLYFALHLLMRIIIMVRLYNFGVSTVKRFFPMPEDMFLGILRSAIFPSTKGFYVQATSLSYRAVASLPIRQWKAQLRFLFYPKEIIDSWSGANLWFRTQRRSMLNGLNICYWAFHKFTSLAHLTHDFIQTHTSQGSSWLVNSWRRSFEP